MNAKNKFFVELTGITGCLIKIPIIPYKIFGKKYRNPVKLDETRKL